MSSSIIQPRARFADIWFAKLVTEDIRFLFALTEKAVLFNQAQRKELVKIIGQQFQVDKVRESARGRLRSKEAEC